MFATLGGDVRRCNRGICATAAWLLIACASRGLAQDLAVPAAPLCAYDGYALPSNVTAGEVTKKCLSEQQAGVRRCDALVVLNQDASAEELASLYRACYVTLHCRYLNDTSSADRPDESARNQCFERAFSNLVVPESSVLGASKQRHWTELTVLATGVVQRVARRGGHTATVLLDAIGPLFPLRKPDRDIDRLLNALVSSAERCKTFKTKVVDYVAQNRRGESAPAAPLYRELVREALGKNGCLANFAADEVQRESMLHALDFVEFVTVSSGLEDRLTLILGGADAVGVDEINEAQSLTVDGRRVYFSAVPRGIPLTLRLGLKHQAGALPPVKTETAAHPIEWWLPELSCVAVEIAVDQQSASNDRKYEPTLLIDGVPAELVESSTTQRESSSKTTPQQPATRRWSASVRLAKGRYRLTVEHQYVGTVRVEHQSLDIRKLEPWDSCATRRIDLSERRAVALVPVVVSPQCRGAGLDRAVFRNMARAALQPVVEQAEPRREWRDYETWQKTLAWMGELPNELGAAYDPDPTRDEQDAARSFARFRVYGAELLSQGIREAVETELICDRVSGRHGYQYSVRATKINVDEANHRRIDLMSGRSFTDILEEEGGTTKSRDELLHLTTNVFRRLFRIPYIARSDSRGVFAYGEAVNMRVEAFIPESNRRNWHLALETKRLEENQSETCNGTEWHSQTWRELDHESVIKSIRLEGNSRRQSYPLSFVPSAPGTYLVKLTLLRVDDPASVLATHELGHDSVFGFLGDIFRPSVVGPPYEESMVRGTFFVCIRVKQGAAVPWVDAMLAVPLGALHLTSIQGIDIGARFTLGDSSAYGAAVGVRRRAFTGDASVSWNDHIEGKDRALPAYDDAGYVDSSWHRYSLPVSIFYEIALFGTGPVYFRPTAILDLGLIDTREVPPGLRHFLQGRKPGDLIFDADLDLKAEFEWRLPLVGFGFTTGVGLAGFDETLVAFLTGAKERAVITFDGYWFWSVGVRWTS